LITATNGATKLSSSTTYSRRTFTMIGVCFVLSGATALIYEVLWARMLGLVFGATTLAVSAVLAAFMGGLAIGSAFAGLAFCQAWMSSNFLKVAILLFLSM